MVIAIVTILVILYVIEKVRFPVTYQVCFPAIHSCTTVARFKDKDWCETFLRASANESDSQVERFCESKFP